MTAAMRVYSKLLVLLFVLGFCTRAAIAAEAKTGTLMLVGDVLSFKQRVIWKRIFELAGGDAADIVVIAAAHERPKLYGGYALRALLRYGPFVELLPVAVSPNEFNTHYRHAVRDPDLVKQVQQANAVFFVGGAPQRLAKVLFNEDGSATPLATAVSQVYAAGGVIVSGIPGPGGAQTGIEAMSVLEQGHLPEQQLYRGLRLITPGWYVDQHFFSAGRFAETLVLMRQLAITYGIGVGANAAAVIKGRQLEIVGDGGVMIINLAGATTATGDTGFNLKGARLSYLDNGDRIDLGTLQIAPDPNKLDAFEIDPSAVDHQPLIENRKVAADMFAPNRLVELLLVALDNEHKQTIGLAFRKGANKNDRGFQFRFYAGDDTIGWLTAESGSERFTAQNIYLDISPLTRRQADDLMR